MNKIAIYKVMIGPYDHITNELFNITENTKEYEYHYFLISDIEHNIPEPWELILVKKKFHSSALENRYYKILVPDEYKKFDYTIYLDCNISINGNLNNLMNDLLTKEKDIYAYPHFRDSTLKQEIINCYIFGKISFLDMIYALRFMKNDLYRKIGFECGVLIRKNTNSNLDFFQQSWFNNYKNNVRRDQFYFHKALSEYNIHCESIGPNDIRKNSTYFKLHPHKEKITFMRKAFIALKMRLFRYQKN